jgi:hypothetical protein
MRSLVLLSGPALAAEDQRLLGLAVSMGVSTKIAAIQDSERFLGEFQNGPCCLAVSAETLAVLHKDLAPSTDLRQIAQEPGVTLLVFGCSGSAEQCSALSWLTAGVVRGISQSDNPDTIFTLPQQAAVFSRQLAGLNFSRPNGEPIPVFELQDAGPASEVIVAANDRPMFVRIDQRPLQLFILAGTALPDLDRPLSRDGELKEHYHGLVPILIFLRHCFRETSWHGAEPTARVIIDDPLLTERYGFLEYGVLQKSMERSHYGTSIAFIPWNHWRTSKRDAARVLSASPNLSVCIHGCDHTNKEFQTQDSNVLSRKAGLALQRMESQRIHTGVTFEPVMVFPQGLFSTAAIAALRDNDYLAAVNTTCFATNIGTHDLKLGDLLRPAVTRYNGFPIFQRRYPRSLFDFAFDFFLGRPAFVVEHHEYFRDNCKKLEEFVAQLYKLEPDLSWPTLTAQLTRSCWKRRLSDGSVEVRFFTRRFQLANREKDTNRFLLSKHEPNSAAVQRVIVDGVNMPFSFEEGFFKFEVQVEPGQERTIEVVDRQRVHQLAGSTGVVHNAGVLVRRGLSEFRDNTLARHRGLLTFAKKVAKGLKVTGNS